MSEIDLIKILANYGAIGVTLIVTFWYITQKDKAQRLIDKEHKEEQLALMKMHYDEREKWAEKMAEMHKEAVDAQNKSTVVVTELVTLIRDRRDVK